MNWKIAAGAACLFLSVLLLIFNLPFMKTWFYILAWWPLILIFDGINTRAGGGSPFGRGRRGLIQAIIFSVLIWLIFELFNLRLKNWNYHSLPASAGLRWLGYFLAFATVLPALVELSAFFRVRLRKINIFAAADTSRYRAGMMVFGGLSLVLALAFPNLFFPMVWLGFFFLIEPINFFLGGDSLLRDIERNDWSRIFSWPAAGLTAGLFWESLNFWAGSHWEYSLPYLNFGRIFQMPVFGYGGFLPFALEVFVLDSLLRCLNGKIGKRRIILYSCLILIFVFFVLAFHLMDVYTVSG